MSDWSTSKTPGVVAILAAGLVLGFSAVSPATAQDAAGQRPASILTSTPTPSEGRVNLPLEFASSDARQILSWVVGTADNAGMPFVIVDKKTTEVFVFDSRGQLLGSTSVLIGLARGDELGAGHRQSQAGGHTPG